MDAQVRLSHQSRLWMLRIFRCADTLTECLTCHRNDETNRDSCLFRNVLRYSEPHEGKRVSLFYYWFTSANQSDHYIRYVCVSVCLSACLLVRFAKILKDPYFCQSLSVCLCVCGWHFYQLALDNFDETWSQVSYYDSLLPRP